MPQRLFRRMTIGLAVAACAVAVAACGSSSSSSSTETTSASSTQTATNASETVSNSKPTLLVYSAQGYAPNGVEAFTKETGIPAKLVEDSTGPLLARIQAEKANPQWGLLWVDGNEAFAGLDQQGMLVKHLTVPKLTSTGKSLVPADRSFVPTGLTTACTMIYDSHAVAKPPTDWNQLLESQWAGKVGMNNPAVSGPTYPCVAGLMEYLGGQSQGEAFLEKLKGAGLKVSETNGDTLHLLETGQISIGLIQSSAAIGAEEGVPGLKVAYMPKETLLPSVIGVDSKASPEVQEEAQEFINWVLSPAGQKQMQSGDPEGDSLFWPVVPGIKPLKALPPLSSISTQTVNPYTWGEREEEINSWFNSNIAQ